VREALEHFLACPHKGQTINVPTDNMVEYRQTKNSALASREQHGEKDRPPDNVPTDIRQTNNGTEALLPVRDRAVDDIRQTKNSLASQPETSEHPRATTRPTRRDAADDVEDMLLHPEPESQLETSEHPSDERRQTENVPANLPDYDHTMYGLGTLCRRGHMHGSTGQSLRRRRPGHDYLSDCVACSRERASVSNARRQATRQAKPA
jgi:hypothetical protein